ncbi:lipoprotein localization protein LolB [Xylella fastidiosa]|uniref:Outer-membrane lipoprotein LolB n=2 Tax=Xylella fastidiosa TaxID=2371 RepID=LOLB_XYLFA|nr:lipoprotein insertase outer membrane protein LolB [Xylella fastidiosa]Q9PA74.1 RecName: Full=Outer-membrane lipoprotein LolB; Flags: Precursor [Xylella fastidiosa 9a5c]AAF85443.1 outer membrane lipoprotein precursor [Xylella fastidiosa 9a5c]ALQ95660.1 membrane protein [Xylella fastidiosa]ALQ97967.1 lipoprotein localization protein LolB [Xylella fastidiosa]ALR05124.1 lipoprotein localization protein LolB [Xylella fastidiosa]ETE28874.1 membrane protein [Xylella fastidiosa 32]
MTVYLHDVNRGLGVFLLVVSFLLPGCSSSGGRRASVPVMVDATAQVVEQARQTWLQEHPNWGFHGRAAISQGRDGGSVRVEWEQHGRGYRIVLSAPMSRQSWVLSGSSSGPARLEGVGGWVRVGEVAEQVLFEATGWQVPMGLLPDWVRGRNSGGGDVQLDAEGRPHRVYQRGWQLRFLDWFPSSVGRPVLPRQIEASRGSARIRLIVDQWDELIP